MTKEEREEAGIVDLPATLAQALVTLQSNEVVCGALGEHLLEHFIEAKEIEWDILEHKFTNGNAINICLFTKRLEPLIQLVSRVLIPYYYNFMWLQNEKQPHKSQ